MFIRKRRGKKERKDEKETKKGKKERAREKKKENKRKKGEKRKKKLNKRKRGEKGIKKLVKKICLRHTLEIYLGEVNSTKNFRGWGKEIKLFLTNMKIKLNMIIYNKL